MLIGGRPWLGYGVKHVPQGRAMLIISTVELMKYCTQQRNPCSIVLALDGLQRGLIGADYS